MTRGARVRHGHSAGKLHLESDCRDCGETRPTFGLGLCTACYSRHRRAGTLAQWRRDSRPARAEAPCACCGEAGPIVGRGLIRRCYNRRRKDGTLAAFNTTRRLRSWEPDLAASRTAIVCGCGCGRSGADFSLTGLLKGCYIRLMRPGLHRFYRRDALGCLPRPGPCAMPGCTASHAPGSPFCRACTPRPPRWAGWDYPVVAA